MFLLISALIVGVLAIGLVAYAIWHSLKTSKVMVRIPAQKDWYK
jgi:hypothetical protein